MDGAWVLCGSRGAPERKAGAWLSGGAFALGWVLSKSLSFKNLGHKWYLLAQPQKVPTSL